jgi:hypothetical protein
MGTVLSVLPVDIRLLHGFLDTTVSQGLISTSEPLNPATLRNAGQLDLLGPMNERVFLGIICASILLLVTAFALGTAGLKKSKAPPERAHLLRLPPTESGNQKGR